MPKLEEEFGIKNAMAVPTLKKIVVNAGIGNEYKNNTGIVEEMSQVLAQITGQRPSVINSKLAISNFKLREGTPNGLKVTLRGDRMWEFFDKLVNIVFPRVKDFRGVNPKAFDGSGNYSVGIDDHTVFPEIDANNIKRVRSLEITIVTTAKTDKEGKILLDKFGFPFKKDVNRG